MTMPVSPDRGDSATVEGCSGSNQELLDGAPELDRSRPNHTDATELAEDLQDDTNGSRHASVDKAEEDTGSEINAAETSDTNEGRLKQKRQNSPRKPRIKLNLKKSSTSSELLTDDDTGNATDMEILETEFEACQVLIDGIEDRSLRRPLSKPEQTELESLKNKLAIMAAELPPGHIITQNASLNMAPDKKASSVSKALTKTKPLPKATLTTRKRKQPPQQKLASAKKPKRSHGSKGKSGQSILSEMAAGSTIKIRSSFDHQPDVKEIKASTVEDQLAQLRERVINLPDADVARIDIETKRLKQAYEHCGGHKRVQAQDGQWLLVGMKTPLHGYQLDAVSWMLRRERGKSLPKGGILADDMGCGKTITALGLIHLNQPPKKNEIKATLVLVPNEQMATQWIGQVLKHCPNLSTHRFLRKRDRDPALFGIPRVIIATYSDVERSWTHIQNTDADDHSEDGPVGRSDKGQVLFHVTFHRLMLDECHLIKNRNSATAKAVFELKAKHVWCISATPTPNSPDEYFPYLKVLGLEHTEDIADYHEKWFDKDKEDADQRLEWLLEEIQIRRTTGTLFMGLPIFHNVPTSTFKEDVKTFRDEENVLYEGIVKLLRKELTERQKYHEEQRNAAFERARKAKRKTNSPESAVSALDRGYFISKIFQVRMLTAHPYMIESLLYNKEGKICFPKEDIEEMLLKLKDSSSGSESVLSKQIKRLCSAVSGGEGSYDMTARSQPTEHELNRLLGVTAQGLRICSTCHQANSPNVVVTECGHQHCEEHWNMVLALSALKGKDQGKEHVTCLVCRKPVGHTQTVDQSDLLKTLARDSTTNAPDDSSDKALKNPKMKKKEKKRCIGDDFNGFQPLGGRCIFLKLSDRDRHDNALLPSAKTQAIMETIESWQAEAPQDKIIVFTQWIMMGKIVGRLLEDRGIPFLYHFGDMKASEREKNLRDFESKDKVKVIVMGFKCSGQGLDMPFANRAILVDPYWNEQGEDQAFARIFRKIQTKKTFFIRLVIKDSIDMRLSNIKEVKTEIIKRLMKEDDPLKRYQMEVEFANFALNGTTEDGDTQSATESVNEETDEEDTA